MPRFPSLPRSNAALAELIKAGRAGGDPRGIAKAVEWLPAGPFEQRDAWLAVPDGRGGARVEALANVARQAPESAA